MRGKGAMPDGIAGHHRITPACAGKSIKQMTPLDAQKDHPRVCGEKLQAFLTSSLVSASPPRVRGKAAMPTLREISEGITPACAGKSLIVR